MGLHVPAPGGPGVLPSEHGEAWGLLEIMNTQKLRSCKHCQHDTYQEIQRKICQDNHECIGWRCGVCQRWVDDDSGKKWISKGKLISQGIDPKTLPVGETCSFEPCARCGSLGAQIHHWAPKFLFGVDHAEDWPKDYLCDGCHREWHSIITPNMGDKS